MERENQEDSAESESEESMEQISMDDIENLPPPPPANFETLVSGLATQSLAAMGQFDPTQKRLDYAKHYIDLLEVVQQKTVRNLTGQEHDMLKTVLHQLRLLFVSVPGGNESQNEKTGNSNS